MKSFIAILLLLITTSMSAPLISSPTDGSEIIKGKYNVLFSASGISGASFLEFWMDNSSAWGSPEVGFNNGQGSPWLNNGIVSASSSFNLTKTMQNKLTQNYYYLKVRTLNSNKDPIGSWSASIKIAILDWNNPPGISYPKDEIKIIKDENPINFSFSNMKGEKAEIWIDNTSGFGSPEIGFNNGASSNFVKVGTFDISSGFSLSKADQNILQYNLYHARIRLLSPKGMPVSDWSSVEKFILKRDDAQEKCLFTYIATTQISTEHQEKNGSIDFTIFSLCDWSVSSGNWIQITSANSGTGNGSFSYRITENISINARQGTITLTSDDDSKIITISQAGKEVVKTIPIATIVSITPEVSKTGEAVKMIGKGYDADGGDVFDYEWKSNLMATVLSTEKEFSISVLKLGKHTITLKVTDDEGTPSELASKVIEVKKPDFVRGFDPVTGFKFSINYIFCKPNSNIIDSSKQCPYYVRQETGIDIKGHGGDWISTAKVKNYPTGFTIYPGSIVSFARDYTVIGKNSDGSPKYKLEWGHIAIVAEVAQDKVLLVHYNWKPFRVGRDWLPFVDGKIAGYAIAGYIYPGTTIPEFGGDPTLNPLADKTVFKASYLIMTDEVEDIVDTSFYGLKKAEPKNIFKIGDSIVFFAETFYALDSVKYSYEIKKDGNLYHSYSESFSTLGEITPWYYPVYGLKFDEIGSYTCNLKIESRGKEFNFSKDFTIDMLADIKNLTKDIFMFNNKKNNISFKLIKNSQVEINLFDCRGRLVWNKKSNYSKGKHNIQIRNISTGVYLCKIKGGINMNTKLYID